MALAPSWSVRCLLAPVTSPVAAPDGPPTCLFVWMVPRRSRDPDRAGPCLPTPVGRAGQQLTGLTGMSRGQARASCSARTTDQRPRTSVTSSATGADPASATVPQSSRLDVRNHAVLRLRPATRRRVAHALTARRSAWARCRPTRRCGGVVRRAHEAAGERAHEVRHVVGGHAPATVFDQQRAAVPRSPLTPSHGWQRMARGAGLIRRSSRTVRPARCSRARTTACAAQAPAPQSRHTPSASWWSPSSWQSRHLIIQPSCPRARSRPARRS